MKYLTNAKKMSAGIVAIGMFASAYYGMANVLAATKSEQAWGVGIVFSAVTFCLFCMVVILWWEAPKPAKPVP